MENNQNEMSPQELLRKLKESLAADNGKPKKSSSEEEVFSVMENMKHTEPEAEVTDEELLRAVSAQDVVSTSTEPTPDAVPVIRYRFKVTRPVVPEQSVQDQADASEQASETPDIPEEQTAVFQSPDTEISFETAKTPDVRELMGEYLSEQEISQLDRISSMPDADAIAQQAKDEAEAAYLAGETPVAEQQEHSEMSLTDEVEVVYRDSAAYYGKLDEAAAGAQESAQEFAQDVPDPKNIAETSSEQEIVPNEMSRQNAMNYIASLTKKAAQASDGVAGMEQLANAAGSAVQSAAEAVQGKSDDSAGTEDVDNNDNAESVEFDEVDVNLMLAFGMEDRLKDAIGEEETEKITQQADEDAKTITSTDLLKAVAEDEKGEEFTDYSQTKRIFAKYKGRYRKTLFKLMASVLIALVLFFYENIPALGGNLPKALDPGYYPVVNIMIGMQLLVFSYALVFEQIKRGGVAALKRKWIPESGTAVIAVLSWLYQILIVIFCRASYTTYNFPVALCFVFSLMYEFMNLKREIYSFNIVASKKMKYALCTMPLEDSAEERTAFREFYGQSASAPDMDSDAADSVPESAETDEERSADVHGSEDSPFLDDPLADKPMYQLKRGAFIDGFFEKIGRYPSYKAILRIFVPAIAALSLLFLILGAIKAASFSYGVSLGYFVLVLCAPMSMFITYSYPLYKASRTAFANESALIGEKSVEEYLDAAEITFEDKDIFPTKGVKVKSIKVYGNHRIDRVVFNAANIFRKYGGPLSQVFNMATLELGTTDEVYFGVIEDDGIEAMVGGSHIYIGKTDYLRRKGYQPGFDDEDEVIEGNGGICVMFMAIEDEVAAKFYIEYTVDHEFEAILQSLYSSGVCIGIRTYDPNIDDRMLNLLLRYGQYPVKVIKRRTEQSENLAREHMDSGIVSRRSVKDMLRAFMSCDRVLRSVKMGVVIKMAAMAAGIVISAIVLIFGAGGIASVYAALYQIFWMIPLLIVTKITV